MKEKDVVKPNYVYVSRAPNPVTVVGAVHHDTKDDKYILSIGVARCGHDDKFNHQQGIDIASHRVRIQPWNRLALPSAKDAQDCFDVLKHSIIDHVQRTQNWAQNLKVNRSTTLPKHFKPIVTSKLSET